MLKCSSRWDKDSIDFAGNRGAVPSAMAAKPKTAVSVVLDSWGLTKDDASGTGNTIDANSAQRLGKTSLDAMVPVPTSSDGPVAKPYISSNVAPSTNSSQKIVEEPVQKKTEPFYTSLLGPLFSKADAKVVAHFSKAENHPTTVSQDNEGINGSALAALLSRLDSLPEALTSATNALMAESNRAQMQAQELVTRFERDIRRFEEDRAQQLDSHRESFEGMKVCIDALHEKWVVAHKDEFHDPLKVGEIGGAGAAKDVFLGADARVANLQDSRAQFLKLASSGEASQKNQEFKSSLKGMENDLGTQRQSGHFMERWAELTSKLQIPKRSSHLRPTNKLARIVEGDLFNAAASLIIVMNTVVLGIQTDIAVKRALSGKMGADPDWFRPVNLILTGCFIVELILRLVGEGTYFFMGMQRLWNMFDSAMVLTAVADEVFANLGGNVSFFRVLRIVKMFRAIRILRVFRYFRDLRIMVCSIMASFVSLAWAFILMLILIYCSAVFICQGIIIRFHDEVMNPETYNELSEFYKDVPSTMSTHIMAISGGLDWYTLAMPLKKVSHFHVGLFVFYVLFVVFGMLNVLTGVFVDRATELSHLDRDLIVESQKRKVEEFCLGLKQIFEEIDSDETGYVSWPEFEFYCGREDVLAYLATMDLNVEETRELFHMLDYRDAGRVNIEDFINGCMRVKGQAKSLDLLHLQEDLMKIKKLLLLVGDQLNAHCEMMEERLQMSIPGMI